MTVTMTMQEYEKLKTAAENLNIIEEYVKIMQTTKTKQPYNNISSNTNFLINCIIQQDYDAIDYENQRKNNN